ncbi:MAG TPA: hypothetical protein VFE71_10555 [Bacteroidales bacterium]|nr:hypothetical protein [Bacteroidales bacterium]
MIFLLLILAIYLLYRLFIGEYNRMDYVLLIIFIAIGLINTIVIIYRRKKTKG